MPMGGADNRASEPITNELIAGRYRATGVLGRGGVGEALAVFDERARRRLALKRNVPLGDERKRELLEAMLRREYAMLAQFAHPHVVEVFDFGSEHGRAFYTMEHLVGAHPGDTGPMPWRDVCAMLVDTRKRNRLHARRWTRSDGAACSSTGPIYLRPCSRSLKQALGSANLHARVCMHCSHTWSRA